MNSPAFKTDESTCVESTEQAPGQASLILLPSLPQHEKRALMRYYDKIENLCASLMAVGEKLEPVQRLFERFSTEGNPKQNIDFTLAHEQIDFIVKKLPECIHFFRENARAGVHIAQELASVFSACNLLGVYVKFLENAEVDGAFSCLCDAIGSAKSALQLLVNNYRLGSIIPGTSFRLGHENSPDQIKSLYDWPEYEERLQLLKPSDYCDTGFLGAQEDFVELLLRDQATVRAAGLSHRLLATLLKRLENSKSGRITVNKQKIECTGIYATMGLQLSPLPGHVQSGNSVSLLKNLSNGTVLTGMYTEMHADLIRLWGFYQGDGKKEPLYEPEIVQEALSIMSTEMSERDYQMYTTPRNYRLDPQGLIRLFNF